MALANRSAVLFSLKAYHLALDDIRLALESGYPKVIEMNICISKRQSRHHMSHNLFHYYSKELRFKLLERRAKILSFYKQHSSAREAYKQTMKALDDAKIDAQKKLKIQKEVQQGWYSNFTFKLLILNNIWDWPDWQEKYD